HYIRSATDTSRPSRRSPASPTIASARIPPPQPNGEPFPRPAETSRVAPTAWTAVATVPAQQPPRLIRTVAFHGPRFREQERQQIRSAQRRGRHHRTEWKAAPVRRISGFSAFLADVC